MKNRYLLTGAILALTTTAVLAQDFRYFPQGYNNARRPAIGADLGQNVRTDSIRFIIDNQDVTGQSSIQSNRVSFQPNYDVDPGAHTAMVSGVNQDGTNFQRSWGFSVANNGNSAYNPYNNNNPVYNYNDKSAYNGYSGNSNSTNYYSTNYNGMTSSGDLSNVYELTPLPLPGQDTDRRPNIGCLVPAGMHPQSYRLIVDGRDFTGAASQNGNRIAFQPDYDLDLGRHQASFTGMANGQRLEQNWEFYVR